MVLFEYFLSLIRALFLPIILAMVFLQWFLQRGIENSGPCNSNDGKKCSCKKKAHVICGGLVCS